MARKADETPRWFDLRIIDRSGVFHVHQHSTRGEARERIRRMARLHYPAEDGHTFKGMAATSDCVTVMRGGTWVADIAAEILEHPAEGAA